MEAQQTTTEVTSVEELSKGDTVTVTGNGADVTREVVSFHESGSLYGGMVARLEGTDFAYQLKSGSSGPLTTGDKMKLVGVGAVNVELHE